MLWLVVLAIVVVLAFFFRSRLYADWWERKYYHFRKYNRWGKVRSINVPKKGHASIHKIISVNRDQANLFMGGLGGFESVDLNEEITIDELLKHKKLSLYSAHEFQRLYIFFETNKQFWNHPFHGMGHRDCVKLGSRVYFVSFDDAAEWVENNCADVDTSEFLFVWNTSRCGSTLMTRILDKCNAPSLSEPHFLDTIYDKLRVDEEISEKEVCARVKTSLHLERILVKNQYPNYEKLCIKPRMGVKFMAHVKKTLPDSKNFLVYRDMGPTVESLSSIGQEHLNHLNCPCCFFNFNPTMLLLELILTPEYPPKKPSVDGLSDKKRFGFGYMFAEIIIVEWLDFLNYWLKESPKLDDYICLRFEELISKDRKILEKMLDFFGFDASYVDLALEGYEKHSQEGHFSQDSSSKTGNRYLSKDQVKECNEIARNFGVPKVLPRSIGHF